MKDTAEQILRNTKASFLKPTQHLYPRLFVTLTNPDNSNSSFYTFEYSKNESQFRLHNGVTRVGDSLIVGGREDRLIIGDLKYKTFLKMNEVDLTKVKRNEIVDLSVDGDRWEGDVLNDKPFGWGVLYNGEGRMVYEGFRIGDVNVCYRRSYYSDVERIEYEGDIFDGTRSGQGTQYDRSGNAVCDDDWADNDRLEASIELTPANETLTNRVEEFTLGDDCYNEEGWSVLDLGLLPLLKVLSMGSNCFKNVKVVRLVGLSELESVAIGANCFTRKGCKADSISGSRFCLKNCPKLRELNVGRHSFAEYSVCEIENVDALEAIAMSSVNKWSSSFQYASLELRSVSVESV